MNKNNKSFLFLGISLLILLISMGSICVQDTDNTQSIDTQDISIQHDSSISDYTTTAKEVDKSKVITKNKDNNTKNVKTAVKQNKKAVEPTTTVTDYETLKQSWNNIKTSGNNETDYIINVKNGNYKFSETLEINTTSNIKSITINGEDPDKTIFNGQNKTRLFNINTTTPIITFNNITFTNGFNDTKGGAIYTTSAMNINNSKFINNTLSNKTGDSYGGSNIYGGAIYTENICMINNSYFIHNILGNGYSSMGGAIYIDGVNEYIPLTIANTEFIENGAENNRYAQGGAIASKKRALFNISNCYFSDNKANYYAAICNDAYIRNYTQNVTRCVFENPYKLQNILYLRGTYNASYNYFANKNNSRSDNVESDLVLLVNGNNPGKCFNKKTGNNLNISLYKIEPFHYTTISNITLAKNYEFTLTSSNNILNLTGVKLSPENNYSIIINLNNLPNKFDEFTIKTEDKQLAKIVPSETTVKFNDVKGKPGETVLLKAEFTNTNYLIQKGKVAFKINDKTIGHTQINFGVAKMNYTIPTDFRSEEYKLTVVYGGTSELVEARKDAKLKLEKLNTKTNLTTTIDGNTLKITVDPKDEKGNTVKDGKICVKIEGKTLQNLKITGKTTVNFTIPKSWNNRQIKILAIYGENNQYKTSRSEITTKITLPKNKETKKEETTTNNYYVSANSGSDTNPGTQTSPFKTIRKAIDIVNSNKQAANIYLDGEFKGVGNTNLTVPGELKINFIGIGNSSIDGEVNYTIAGEDGDYSWGSSAVWTAYNNGHGNWAMRITKGEGLITINNLTIKNCWNPGGSNINAYPSSTVYNFGHLEVNNVSFIFNHGGVGAALRNANGSYLKVTNSLFEANRKSSSTGNYGAGVYNNGTATIINSTFQKNYARWGTITNDKNLTIINSTIRDNIGYDGGSTYKFGSGIAINTGGSDFFDIREISGINTVIDGCTFINNDQLDISADTGNLNLTNSVFNRSTGVVAPNHYYSYKDYVKFYIVNNTFDSPIGSSLYTSLSSSDKYIITLRLQGNYNCHIENNTVLNETGSNSKALELIAENSIVKNNTFTRSISLTVNNTQITGNNITTSKDEYAIGIADGSKNNTIVANELVGSTYQGDGAVTYIPSRNTIINNTPKVSIIRLNDETFYIYFDDDGNLKPEYSDIQQIQITDSLNNKVLTINNANIKIAQRTTRIISYNTTIITKENGYVNITGLKINNTNQEPVVILNSDNNIITKAYFNTTNAYAVIINQTQNNTIENNNFIADLFVGDEATTQVNNNIITSNKPTYKNYLITDETYNTFFENDGTIKTTTLNETRDIRLILGKLNNKTLLLNNNRTITIKRYHDEIQQNITIKTENTKINMTNMTIINTNKKQVLDLNSQANIIRSNNITSNSNIVKIENETDLSLEHNNIYVNSNENVTVIEVINSTNADISYNNMTITGNNSIIVVEAIDSNNSYLSSNKIIATSNSDKNDTYVCSINLINSEKSTNSIFANTLKTSGINACGINVENQILTINGNSITTNGRLPVGIKVISSTLPMYNGGITGNTISSSSNTSIGIILQQCENLTVTKNTRINITGKNITGIILNQTRNTTINGTQIILYGENTTLIKLENTKQINITSNTLESLTKDKKITPVQLNNAEDTRIFNNTIKSSSEYAISIDNKSSKSVIISNRLYASNLGNKAVLKQSNNKVEVIENTPEISLNYYLNEETYTQFFDENGVLRDDVPNKYNIILAGNLYNKTLNITHPINMTSEGVTLLINSTLIINANYTNITKISMQGEDTKIVINADKTNIELGSINTEITKAENKTLITIQGNKNKIQISPIGGTKLGTQSSNITIFKVKGKQNNIKVQTIDLAKFENSTGVLLNNTTQNMINISKSIRACNVVMLNNSNLNRIMLNSSRIYHNGILLSNSSNNMITATDNILNSNDDGSGKAIVVEENSNNNLFMGIGINMFTVFNTPPITITNSSNNTISNSNIQFKGNCYAIEIIEGENNTIQNNVIKSSSLSGNKAVYQYYNDEMEKNILKNNNQSGPAYYTNIRTVDTIKVGNTITLNATCNYNFRDQKGYFTFYVNGKEIGTVDTGNSSTVASINYTITGDEGNELLVDVAYYGGNYSSAVRLNSSSFTVIKMDSNILIPTVKNDGKMTNITALIIGEDGNIIYNGKVAFKINQKTVGVVNIKNGIAQISIDSSKYNLGEHEIQVVYSGNNQYAKSNTTSTLTVIKYDVKIDVNPITANPGSKATLKATVKDMQGNNVNTGRVVFKLNGRTLKDSQGNTITAQVKNGEATIEYMIPSNYSAKDYILTAVASDSRYDRIETNTTLTVAKA